MNTTKILSTSLLALLAAACSSGDSKNQSTAAPTAVAPQRLPTVGAARVTGDIVPTRLVAMAIPKPTEMARLSGSDAMAPKKLYLFDAKPEIATHRDLRRVMKGTDPAAFTFPIDAPEGARVIIQALDKNLSLRTVHMHDVKTGARLDRARDASTPVRRPVVRPDGVTPPKGTSLKPLPADDEVAREKALLPPIVDQAPANQAKEPAFAALAVSARQLSFDVPYGGGLVQLDLPADVAAAGVLVDVQQPKSRVTIAGAATELSYGFGDNAQINIDLAADTTALDGATVTAWAEYPDHSRSPDLSFVPLGGGKYKLSVPLASADLQLVGAWSVHVKATGMLNGAPYERDLETAFGYWPAHAQMTAISTPLVTRGADGLIDDIAVDVDVETLADDRFSVRGTLTYTDAAGAEHAVASAQTGETLKAGTGTITLHFNAESLAVARVDGPFQLRDVALTSQAFVVTQHRLGRALDLSTEKLDAKSLRFPKSATIQVQDLIDNGDLDPLK